jgi:hypothetical protein
LTAAQPVARLDAPIADLGRSGSRFERFAGRVSAFFVRHGPGLSLWVLSPVIAELVLGSSPPLVALIFGWIDLLMYGGGAVIIRELVRRWGKGWPSILVLGIAYGIAEEGFAIRSFFNPNWNGAAGLDGYGWVGGINWFWTTELALYHAIVSITLPILIVGIAFRTRRDEPWIPGGSLARVIAGFLLSIALLWAIVPLAVPAVDLVGCVAAMAVCFVIARALPARVAWPALSGWAAVKTAPRPRTVFLVCLALTTFSFVFVFGRGFGLPWQAGSIVLVLAVASGVAWLLRASAGAGWDDRHRFAVPAGVIAFFVGFSPIVELSGGLGEVVVGIITAVVLRRAWVSLSETVAGRTGVGDSAA